MAYFNLPNKTLDLDGDVGLDFMVINVFDKDGVNSRMTGVFGVVATGEEYIAPRQLMTDTRYTF